jgi:hypothetical protein
MFSLGVRVAVFAVLLGCPLAAQEAIVRTAAQVEMPTQVDSNSPAFWRDGRLFWFGSHGRPWLSEGSSLFGPWETREISVETTNQWPHWLESVWPEDDAAIWGWYHCEPVGLIPNSTMTAPKVGAMISADGGRTLRDLGVVLESGDPLDPAAANGYFAGGHGDFTVLPDRERRYFYFFFDNYGGAAESQGVCLARMAYEDRANPVGKVWKYYNGSWQEAGRGGRVTPIFPVNRAWQTKDPDAFWGPSVHWNTHLQCHVMLLNRAAGEPGWSQEGVYVSFSYDLSRPDSWTTPRKLIDKSQFPGWYFFYPQVMGLDPGGTDRRAGQTARLFVGGISKWEIEFIAPPAAPAAVQVVSAPGPVTAGAGATFSVVATGSAPFTYQWLKNGSAIPQATGATYVLPTTTVEAAGDYSVLVSNALGATESNRVTLNVTVPPPPPPESFLTNLAVRAKLGPEDSAITLGFVLRSSAPKPMLVRAVGPSLALFGIDGSLADPRLALYDDTAALIAENDDWPMELAATFAPVGAFALPAGSADAALLVHLPAGATTARASGPGSGVALVEVYDPAASARSKIINFSARALVGQGEDVMIAGFGLDGAGTKRILLRALGPQLEAFGVTGVLANPLLEVFAADGTKLAENDDWDPDLAPVFATAGASALPAGSRDAAVVLTLSAGLRYTLVVRGDGAMSGEALLEIYELP